MRHLLLAALLLAGSAASCQQPAPAAQEPQPPAGTLRERAAAAEAQGRIAEAAELWRQLAEAEPDRVEFALAAGRCLGLARRFNDAMDLLAARQKQFPAVLDLQVLLARTFMMKAEADPGVLGPDPWYADAAARCEQVLAVDPDHREARLILAQARLVTGDLDGAAAAATETTRRHPTHAGAFVLLGQIGYTRMRLLRDRLQDPAAPPDDERRRILGEELQQARTAAAQALTRAVELDPTRHHALVLLGDLAAQQEQTEAAAAHYFTALAVEPDARVPHPWIEANIAWEPRAQRYAEALQRYLARPLPDPRKAATLRFYRARALYAGGRWQEVLDLCEQVKHDNPAHVNADWYAALAAFRLDLHDRAEAHAADYARAGAAAFADVIRTLPTEERIATGEILKFLADRAWQQDRKDHSRELNHVVACLRDSADAWNNYAFLCRETGLFAQSVDAYQSALEKEPDSPQLLNDLGVVLQYHLPTAANLERARGLYTRAVAEADRLLARPDLPERQRTQVQQSRQDARLNLDKLPAK